MKKYFFVIVGIFFLFNLLNANENVNFKSSQKKIAFNFQQQQERVPLAFNLQQRTPSAFNLQEGVQKFAASAGGGGSASNVLQITGITVATTGFVMMCFGIPMIYINAVGLGYTTSTEFEVQYFDNNLDFGRAAFYAGVALLTAGTIFLVGGIIVATIGFMMAKGGSRARLFLDNNDRWDVAAVGVSYKL